MWFVLDMTTKLPSSGRTRSPIVQPITFKKLYCLYELLTLMSEYQRLISIIAPVLGGSNSGIAIGKSNIAGPSGRAV